MYPDLMRQSVAWRLKAFRDAELRGYLISLHSRTTDIHLVRDGSHVWRLRGGVDAARLVWGELARPGDVLLASDDLSVLVAEKDPAAASAWARLRGYALRRALDEGWASPAYGPLCDDRPVRIARFVAGEYQGLDQTVTKGDD